MLERRSSEIRYIIHSQEFEKVIKKLKKKKESLFEQLVIQMVKVTRVPNIGKPLRYTLKNRRRLHVGSFVLIYDFFKGELKFIDFDHHDKIYKKY